MTNGQQFQEVWTSYQQAVQELYRAPRGIEAEPDRSVGQIYVERLESSGDHVLSQATAVRTTLEESLTVDDSSQRELASLKLIAAAAYDLSVANDLLELEQADPEEEIERSARSVVIASDDLRQVLDADLTLGMGGIIEVERGVLPNEPDGARKALDKAVTSFLKDIPEDAAELGQTAVGGVTTMGLGLAQSVVSLAVQEILAQLPDGVSIVTRRAARIVGEAIEKLRAALGTQIEEKVREEAQDWIKDIEEKRDTVTSLLDKLYETTRIGEETKVLIKGASETLEAEAYNSATRTLEELMERSKKTRKTLNIVMRVIAFIQAPLTAAPPWGPLAIYAAYLSILGYAVYIGGDYLDWYRIENVEWLDRVPGLRTTVSQAVKLD